MPSVLVLALLATQTVAGAQATINASSRSDDRFIPLVSRSADSGEYCTSDRRWCVMLAEPDENGVVRPIVGAGGAVGPMPRAPAEEPSSDESYAVWPSLFTLRDGSFLAGVKVRTSTSYSGGGGSATDLRLFRVSSSGTASAEPVLSVSLEGSLMIRACFSERDLRRRRGACHDEYRFSSRIGLAPGAATGLPILTYATEAWAYPRGVTRSGDSTQMRALRQSDLVRQRDVKCSFGRRFRFDVAGSAYRPDMPLPECSDYTVP
jgi:hypothetical protein